MIEHGLKIVDVAGKPGIVHNETGRFVDLARDSASTDSVESALMKLGCSL